MRYAIFDDIADAIAATFFAIDAITLSITPPAIDISY